jgi:hypothetical protein
MTALIALGRFTRGAHPPATRSPTQADTVLSWDPADRTLIIANIVGKMPWTEQAQSSPPVG